MKPLAGPVPSPTPDPDSGSDPVPHHGPGPHGSRDPGPSAGAVRGVDSGSHTGARICTIAAFACAVVALVVYPPVLALAAVVLGVLGARRGDKPLGWYATAAGVAGGIVGMVLGAIAAAAR